MLSDVSSIKSANPMQLSRTETRQLLEGDRESYLQERTGNTLAQFSDLGIIKLKAPVAWQWSITEKT